MDNKYLSIIVPVYNTENYLERCLNSIINQTVTPFEVLLIDDGSTDNSAKICEKYATNYDYIKVIHQDNKGPSIARNVGIQNARGEYVVFVDSDDSIDCNACQSVLEYINTNSKLDVLVVGISKIIKKNKINICNESFKLNKILNGKEYLYNELLKKNLLDMDQQYVCNRSFLINHNIFFEPNLLHEDNLFTFELFFNANYVLPTNIIYYNYFINKNSITTKKSQLKNFIDVNFIIKKICNDTENYIFDNKLKHLIKDFSVDSFYCSFDRLNFSEIKEVQYDKEKLIENSISKKNKLRTKIFTMNKYLFYCIEKMIRFLLNKNN